jgi:hypothetical protein
MRTRAALLALGVSVALEMNLNALRQEALTAFGTAATEDATPADGFHAGTKAELLFARSFGWLVGPFAHKRIWSESC